MCEFPVSRWTGSLTFGDKVHHGSLVFSYNAEVIFRHECVRGDSLDGGGHRDVDVLNGRRLLMVTFTDGTR